MTTDLNLMHALMVEEYKAARERISKEIDVMNNLEGAFILAAGAIVAFVFTKDNRDTSFFRVAMISVSMLGFYGMWRYSLHRKIVRIHETFIKEHFEKIITGNGDTVSVGLATYYDQNKSRSIEEIGTGEKSGSLKKARYVFWCILAILPQIAFALSFYSPNLFGLLASKS